MRGIIVYDREVAKKRQWYIGEYVKNFERRNVGLSLVYTDDLRNGQFLDENNVSMEAEDISFAIVRDIAPDVSRMLEGLGIRCFNSARVSEICNDKYSTYRFVGDNGLADFLPVATTPGCDDFPLVIKARAGHGGTQVFWADNYEEYCDILSGRDRDDYIVQKPCDSVGVDVRVYVVGDEIIAAMKRENKNTGDIRDRFKSNYCLGGSASVYDFKSDSQMMATVNNIAKALKPDFVGIDFIFHEGRWIFNEIEDVVGARMLYDLTDIDIVDIYVEYILNALH